MVEAMRLFAIILVVVVVGKRDDNRHPVNLVTRRFDMKDGMDAFLSEQSEAFGKTDWHAQIMDDHDYYQPEFPGDPLEEDVAWYLQVVIRGPPWGKRASRTASNTVQAIPSVFCGM